MTKEYELQVNAWLTSENYTEGLRLWKQRYGENIVYKALCYGPNDFNRDKMRSGLTADIEKSVVVPEKEPDKVAELEKSVEVLGDEISDITSEVSDMDDKYSIISDDVENLEGTVSNMEGDLDEVKDTVRELGDQVKAFLDKNKKPAVVLPKRADIIKSLPKEVQEWKKTTYGLMDERTLLKERLRNLPDPYRREDRHEAAKRILDITDELDMLFGKIGYYEEHGRVPSEEVLDDESEAFPKRYLNLRTYVSRTKKKLLKATDPAIRKSLEDQIEGWKLEMKEFEINL